MRRCKVSDIVHHLTTVGQTTGSLGESNGSCMCRGGLRSHTPPWIQGMKGGTFKLSILSWTKSKLSQPYRDNLEYYGWDNKTQRKGPRLLVNYILTQIKVDGFLQPQRKRLQTITAPTLSGWLSSGSQPPWCCDPLLQSVPHVVGTPNHIILLPLGIIM